MIAKELEALNKKHTLLQNKLQLIKELEVSTKEVKLMIQGKKKGKSLAELVNELQD